MHFLLIVRSSKLGMGGIVPIFDMGDWLYGVFYLGQPNNRNPVDDLVGSDTESQIDHDPPADHGVVGEVGATRRVIPTETSLRR